MQALKDVMYLLCLFYRSFYIPPRIKINIFSGFNIVATYFFEGFS